MPSLLEPFLQKAPCCVLARTVLEHLFDPVRLDQLFHEAAEDQYQRELLFSDVLHLMLTVVLRTKASVHAAYRESGLGVRHQSVYDKLKRLDLPVSEAVVADSAWQVRAAIVALQALRPEPVPGFRARIVDGNLLGKTQRRLKPLRATWARGLPGRVLAVYEPACDLVTHAFLEPDGHADERSRMGDVLDLAAPGDLWIADSHFCTHTILAGLRDAGAAFAIRQHGSLKGLEFSERRRIGRGDTGVVYEQMLEMIGDNAGWILRRLILVLDSPTRDGVTEIAVLTNVPESRADAITLLEAYRQRWTIEKRFYDVAQTLHAEPRTLAYPPAALFAFCLGLVASNAVALMRASLRAVHGAAAVESLSNHYVAEEIRETYRGMTIGVPPAEWTAHRATTVEALAARLREIAGRVRIAHYRKSVRGPKKPPPAKPPYVNGLNHSTQRLLDEQKHHARTP